MHPQSVSHVQLLWPMDCSPPGSSILSRQEYWSELSFPPPGDLPNLGTKPRPPASPALAGRLFTTEPPGKNVKGSRLLKQTGKSWRANTTDIKTHCHWSKFLPTDRPINQERCVGSSIATLFRKSADWEDDGLVSQRTIFPKLEFRLLLY